MILNSSSRATLVNVPIFFMTANQYCAGIQPILRLTFANFRVGQGVNGDILVILDSFEKCVVGWHFLLVSWESAISTRITYISGRRSLSEESTLELVTPVLDLDTFWVGREWVCMCQLPCRRRDLGLYHAPSSAGGAASALAAGLALDLSALALVAFGAGASSSSSTSA